MDNYLFETKRLVARPLITDDLEALVAILSDPEVTRFIPEPNDRAGIQARLKQWTDEYEKNGFGFLALINKETNSLIGYGGFIVGDLDGKPYIELGYCIAKEYWNQGYATEAAAALKEYGFNQLNISELYSIISEANIASLFVTKKIGMTLLKQIKVEDHPYPCYIYHIKSH